MISWKNLQIFLCVALIEVYFAYSSLPWKTFRCENGKFILDQQFCNAQDDCGDGSDEANGCEYFRCNSGSFSCESQSQKYNHLRSCSSVKNLCNNVTDCPGNSDELHCGDLVHVDNCSLSDGKFLCKDNKRCLDFEYTCDGACNCLDCSDEAENCTRVDPDLLRKCPHAYFPTPDGPACLCDEKSQNYSEKLCEELENCTGSKHSSCQQKCTKYKEKVFCSCYDDYTEIPGKNGFECRHKSFLLNTLIYSTSNQIKSLNISTNEITVVKSDVECGVLTAAHNYVYYTSYDDNNTCIFKTSINSSTRSTTKVVRSDSPIRSIAIDYITDNIYFTSNNSLSVCSNDGRICAPLKCCNTSYVALAPSFGLMFFTKKSHYNDERFIVKSNLDGSGEKILIDGTFRDPVPLVVEESIGKIYFLETTHNIIHSVSYKGEENDVNFLKLSGTMVSFAALENKLYFTKSRDNEIYAVENIELYTKRAIVNEARAVFRRFGLSISDSGFNDFAVPIEMLSDHNATEIVDNKLTLAVRSLFAFNPLLQKLTAAKNPCSESSCSGLCLPEKEPSSYVFDQICLCDGFTPVKDTNNWCDGQRITDSRKETEEDVAKTEARSSDDYSKGNSGHTRAILTTLCVIIILALVVAAAYVVFQKQGFYGYGLIRNFRLGRRNDQMDNIVYNGEDL